MSLNQFKTMSKDLIFTSAAITIICSNNIYFDSEVSALLAARIALKYTNNSYSIESKRKYKSNNL